MYVIYSKLRDVFLSVLPIIILVLLLNFTIAPLGGGIIYKFLIGALLVVIGLTVFLIGTDIGVSELGGYTGKALAKTNSISIVLAAGIVLGFFISIAEPGLMVLAGQVNLVTGGAITGISILLIVSVGLAIMLSLGFMRIFYNVPLYKVLLALYGFIFILSLFCSREFLAIAFDASGATTGILAVPFILSLSVGISALKKDSKASEKDSFGLVAIASAGAIIGVMLLGIFVDIGSFTASLSVEVDASSTILHAFAGALFPNFKDAFMAILPLIIILMVMQKAFFHLYRRELRKLFTGFILAFLGLFIFLVGVNAGFMDVGIGLGMSLALIENKVYIIVVALVMGVVTILAEPAVYVLTHQIEDVTSSYVKRNAVLVPLAIGVGGAVMLSVIRVLVPKLALWHMLLPGYAICIGLMFVVPKLFVGIAFDAGGVATGPMTATFILAFVQGAAQAYEGADLMADGFGMIAMVAMMPIVTLELLGLIFSIKLKKNELEAHNE